MKLSLALLASFLAANAAASVIDPAAVAQNNVERHAEPEADTQDHADDLWKRRGGGGGGGGRGGGGSSGGNRGGGGSSGGSSGGNRGGGSGSGRGTNTQTNSNRGGYSRDGTGPQPSFVGGTYYPGGATTPYPAGGSPPGRTLNNYPVSQRGLAFYPGYWPVYGGFYYPYGYHYGYYNRTSKKDEEKEIICVCAKYSVCACDDIDNDDFYEELIEDGDWDKLNKSMVTVAKVNGTDKIVINGTLPNGTTIPTDDEELYEMYLNSAMTLAKSLGYWPAVAAVGATVILL